MVDTELVAAATATSAVVLSVADDELDWRTPCEGYDVRGVVNHLMGVLTVAERAGRRAPGLTPEQLWVDRMAGDWRASFTELVKAALAVWADECAWRGRTELLGRPFAAADAGRKLVGELLVHGWDVAQATGRPYQPDAAAVRMVHEYFARSLADGRSPGAWGPEVAVSETAPTMARVLGLSGRNPHWR